MSEKRVLIVDDSKDIGRMIAAALGTLDPSVQVKMMSSAEEAVLEITRTTFDLLVIDIRLPGISGLDLSRRIRSRNPNLKIVQISAIDDPQIADEALKAGANAFFHKPISMSEFLKTTAQYLGLRSADTDVQISVEFQSEGQSGKMADVLNATRKSVGALAVVMSDSRGSLVMQAGRLPDPTLEQSLIPELLEVLLASAKVGVRLGETQPEHVLCFRGPAFHVLVAPIFAGYALMIILKAEKPALRMAIAFEEALTAQHELYHLIQSAGLPETAAAPVETAKPAAKPAAAVPSPAKVEPKPAPVAAVYSPPPVEQSRSSARSTGSFRVEGTVPPPHSRPLEPLTPAVEAKAPPQKVEEPKPAETRAPETPPAPPPEPRKSGRNTGRLKEQAAAQAAAEAAALAAAEASTLAAQAAAQARPAKPAEPPPPVEPAKQASLEDTLDSLLKASGDRRLQSKEIDAFWDDLSSQETNETSEGSEMISYEQAIKMGLAPKDPGK
jgi:CheY-like chemotaxis protein